MGSWQKLFQSTSPDPSFKLTPQGRVTVWVFIDKLLLACLSGMAERILNLGGGEGDLQVS